MSNVYVDAYRKHKNLKIAAMDVGIPRQTLYSKLKKLGEPVTGNKLIYGSETDKLSAKAEERFLKLVPQAKNQNNEKWQSKVDALVFNYGVDIKAARPRLGHHKAKSKRWAFSLKKQESVADFFVCFCFDDKAENVLHYLLIPGDIARCYTTMTVSTTGNSHWFEYEVRGDELNGFFLSLPPKSN